MSTLIWRGQYYVSILSQLRCWEQPRDYEVYEDNAGFQSSPSLGAGSNMAVTEIIKHLLKFQSSPSLGAGSNL